VRRLVRIPDIPGGGSAVRLDEQENLGAVKIMKVQGDKQSSAEVAFRSAALQEAAKRILNMEQDRGSAAYEAARFVVSQRR
jgi:hypothetical protein